MQVNGFETESLAICPYCKKTLEKMPQRKKKCPFCKNSIYVRTLPSTRNKVLATEDDTKKIDAEWTSIQSENNWMSKLKPYGITENDFNKRKNKLSESYGFEANSDDVYFSILNELVTKTDDLQNLKMIYFQMALFLRDEGRDFFHILQESSKTELLHYKQVNSHKKVRINVSGNSCEMCQQLKDKVLTTEEALQKMLIPCKKCTHQKNDENLGWCRCGYAPYLDF